jgi:hypothetical protein
MATRYKRFTQSMRQSAADCHHYGTLEKANRGRLILIIYYRGSFPKHSPALLSRTELYLFRMPPIAASNS